MCICLPLQHVNVINVCRTLGSWPCKCRKCSNSSKSATALLDQVPQPMMSSLDSSTLELLCWSHPIIGVTIMPPFTSAASGKLNGTIAWATIAVSRCRALDMLGTALQQSQQYFYLFRFVMQIQWAPCCLSSHAVRAIAAKHDLVFLPNYMKPAFNHIRFKGHGWSWARIVAQRLRGESQVKSSRTYFEEDICW